MQTACHVVAFAGLNDFVEWVDHDVDAVASCTHWVEEVQFNRLGILRSVRGKQGRRPLDA